MNPLRNIATIAAVALALTAGTALANTNTPTVQPVHHWPPGNASNPKAPQHSVTIGVSSHGRGIGGSKPSSPHWR